MAKAETKKRVRLLDGLRGAAVVNMVAYHALYDLVYIYGVDVGGWYRGWPGYLWQQGICWCFILVSGASLHYGRAGWKRSLLVLGCAMVLTAVTALATPGLVIRFGVLHMLGCAMLLFYLLRRWLERVPPAVSALCAGALFVLGKGVPRGFVGLLDHPLFLLPQSWYQTGFLFPLGLPGPQFASSDYFPLVPWLFLFLAGYYLWGLVKGRAKPAAPSTRGRDVVSWMGRNSLWIYMLHQPVLYGLFWALAAGGVL